MRNASRFERGSGVYACGCCKRSTRSTGRGDNENARLCAECFDLAGEVNSLSDTGQFYDSAENVLAMIAAVAAKGGDASCWESVRARALKESFSN